jgi:hypothetical protein
MNTMPQQIGYGKIDIDEKQYHGDRRELGSFCATPFDESNIFSSTAQFAVYS